MLKWRAIDSNVAHRDVADVLYDIRLCHATEVTVDKQNFFDRRILESAKIKSILRLLRAKFLDAHIADHGAKAARFAFFIVEVDRDRGIADLTHGDIAHVDILDQAATHGVVFQTDRDIEFRAVHLTTLGEHSVYAARNFTADGNSAVPIFHMAIADDDVL